MLSCTLIKPADTLKSHLSRKLVARHGSISFRRNFIYFLPILFICQPVSQTFSQNKAKIEIVKAKTLEYDNKAIRAQRLIGNVVLKHEDTYLYCDSAYIYEESNSTDAFGHVRIYISDTLSIFGDYLNYNGNTRIAELHDSVRLVDNKATLTTNHLTFNRNTETATYYNGGKIVDSKNTLTSKIGYYFTQKKEYFFKDSVSLVNPEYDMLSDTLRYNTISATAYFYGPTVIHSDENVIYCENGWYNTDNDISQFRKNAYIIKKERSVTGDSLFYDRTKGLGIAIRNVIINDTVQHIVSTGQYAEYRENDGYFFITDSTVATIISDNDSLFLHSDTLWVTFDTAQEARTLLAYHSARFFRNDLQGQCDSLVYDFTDSIITLNDSPILWTKSNQLTADTIKLLVRNNTVDKMYLINSAFIISLNKTDLKSYDQLKGKIMTGYLSDGHLKKIFVNGNAETLYYVREDDGSLIGIDKAESSDISSIVYLVKPTETLYPEKDLPESERKLKNFKWYSEERPKSKMDIFRKVNDHKGIMNY